jgi:hypothetical protein
MFHLLLVTQRDQLHFEVPHPILVCTYTNVAVDNLVEGFATAGVKPLRVGYGSKVKASLYEHTLDHKIEIHPLKYQVDRLAREEKILEEQVTDLRSCIHGLRDAVAKNLLERQSNMRRTLAWKERCLSACRSKMYRMRQRMLRDILDGSDVVRKMSLLRLFTSS